MDELFLLPTSLTSPFSSPSCQTNNTQQSGCQLLDGFALVVQAVLAFTVLLLLLWKRRNEKPQRPFSVWSLDVSKQFVGAGMIHCLNIQVSYIAHYDNGAGNKGNLCIWYLISILYDTTLGLVLLYGWLQCLTLVLARWCHIHIPTDYGDAPFRHQLKRWAQQTSVFVMAELLMKLCQFWCFRHIPWFFHFGKWLLDFNQGNYHQTVIMIMFVYPLVMNAVQFWMIDTMLKFHRCFLNKNASPSVPSKTKEPSLPYAYAYLYPRDYDFSIASSSPPSVHVLVHTSTYPNEYTYLLSPHC